MWLLSYSWMPQLPLAPLRPTQEFLPYDESPSGLFSLMMNPSANKLCLTYLNASITASLSTGGF